MSERGAAVRGIPPDAAGRVAAHDEVHARPVTPVPLPSMVTQLTVLTQGRSAAEESAYLRGLAGGAALGETDVGLTLELPRGARLTWEHHGEYSLYTVLQPVDDSLADEPDPDLLALLPLPAGWLAGAPGRTLAAVHVVLLPSGGQDDALRLAQGLLGPGRLLGSLIKDGSARLFTTYRLRADGTSRFLVVGDGLTDGRAGRLTAALLAAERYRMLALLGFPLGRALVPRLDALEERLAEVTRSIEDPRRDDRALLDELIALAAQVENEIAAHGGRFGASLAYFSIVQQRIDELRGTSLPGLMGVFTFLRRRLLPAMATVESSARRMDELSARVARTADLLRTRVEVTTEAQNQDLLRELRTGQAVQLRLQETVEGLSIAAISYYVVNLIGDAAKGLDAAGWNIDVELTMAGAIPLVLAGVWLLRRRIARHARGPDRRT